MKIKTTKNKKKGLPMWNEINELLQTQQIVFVKNNKTKNYCGFKKHPLYTDILYTSDWNENLTHCIHTGESACQFGGVWDADAINSDNNNDLEIIK